MVISRIGSGDYHEFLQLYNEAFPPDERRLYESGKQLHDFIKVKLGRFDVFVAMEEGIFLGFLTYWTFGGYTYVEHFAVNPENRGKGIGTFLLNHLIKEVSENVLLEVELPENDEARRRVAFYERNGFRKRENIDYMQPAYGQGQKPVKLLLMTHGDVNLHDKATISEMHREVYNVDTGN